MKSTFGTTKIVFLLLFMLLFISINAYNVRANPDKETLYVNGFDSTYTEWSTSGSSPYINDSDDYIYAKSGGYTEGYFTFTDTGHSSDTLNSVEIYFECYQQGSDEWFEVWIYDGSGWSDMGDIIPDTSYGWKSMDISSKIDSWTKVDACQLYVVYQKVAKADYIYVRRCYLYVDYTAVYNLNLHVMDWDLTDAIQGATVYKDEDIQISDADGWANWTQVTGTVQIKVSYYGFWVNGTFSVTMDEDKTINVQCKLYDVVVTVQETMQNAILVPANVSVFNGSSTQANHIVTGITNSSGQLSLYNLPNNTLTFTLYAGSDYTLKIGNSTQLVSSEGQSITRTADENYVSTSHGYNLIVFVGFVLSHFFKRPPKRYWGLRLRRKQKQYKLKPNSENTYNAS